MARLAKSNVDLVTSFRIFLNKQKLGGVLSINIKADMTDDLKTKVNLVMAIKRDSFKLVRKDGLRLFYFDVFGLTKGRLELNGKKGVDHKTLSDHTHNDIIIMNGKKLSKCINFKYSLSSETGRGTVELELLLKQNGLEIKRRRRGLKDVYLEI